MHRASRGIVVSRVWRALRAFLHKVADSSPAPPPHQGPVKLVATFPNVKQSPIISSCRRRAHEERGDGFLRAGKRIGHCPEAGGTITATCGAITHAPLYTTIGFNLRTIRVNSASARRTFVTSLYACGDSSHNASASLVSK